MKTRNGFVSNSSSSSFVAALNVLTKQDIDDIVAYGASDENTDGWTIYVDDEAGLLRGSTIMDNGAFPEWCMKNGFNKVRFEA